MYLDKKIMCEECLSPFTFTGSDLYKEHGDEEDMILVECPFCGNAVEIYDVEDYGILPEEVGGYDEMESDTEIYGE